MKPFSFSIFILCILLPPFLYVVTLSSLEERLRDRYTLAIEQAYAADTAALLNGGIRLKDAIAENIDRYLADKRLAFWGIDMSVTVVTQKGRLLYPADFDEDADSLLPKNPMKTAAENYALMNEGPAIQVNLTIGHNTLLSNLLLGAYVLLSVLLLYAYFRKGVKRVRVHQDEQNRRIAALSDRESGHRDRLEELDREKGRLTSALTSLKDRLDAEQTRASRNEEELIEDIVSLETEIQANLRQQQERQQEIDALKERIDAIEKSRKKRNISGTVQKRFKALYKNVTVHEKAADGFMDLTEGHKIKCEEVIHQLDRDPKLVIVKRKVFGKKSRETVLEVIFGYKGRLYFRNLPDNRIEVLAVGTKNTQQRELEFLERL